VDIAQLVQEFGYLAIAIGSFLEGEAVLLAGSFAASQGYLDIVLVMAIAALGSFLGDLPYFFAGRRYGESIIERFPSLHCHKGKLDQLMQKHHIVMVISLRFLYGLRIPGLLTLGMSKLCPIRFLFFNFIGAFIWAIGVCAAGYGAGRAFSGLLENVDSVESISMFVAILLASGVLTMLTRRWIAARKTQNAVRISDKHQ
jgi:membrane protein DedA with SNARE-associated domain